MTISDDDRRSSAGESGGATAEGPETGSLSASVPLCARVLDRMVESAGRAAGAAGRQRGKQDGKRAVKVDPKLDPRSDPELAAHLGSCMACFRALSELRDVPRIAAAMHEGRAPTASDAPPAGDPFWDELAARTIAAAAEELPPAARPAAQGARREPRRDGGWRAPGRAAVVAVATALAAAAGFLLVAHRPVVDGGLTGTQAGARAAGSAAAAERAFAEQGDGEPTEELDDLDGAALQRLLEKLRADHPRELTALAGATPDLVYEDDGLLGDEIVDLGASELLQLERSLEGEL